MEQNLQQRIIPMDRNHNTVTPDGCHQYKGNSALTRPESSPILLDQHSSISTIR